jgi:hypothetical protein
MGHLPIPDGVPFKVFFEFLKMADPQLTMGVNAKMA